MIQRRQFMLSAAALAVAATPAAWRSASNRSTAASTFAASRPRTTRLVPISPTEPWPNG